MPGPQLNEEYEQRIAQYKEKFMRNLEQIYSAIPDMPRLSEDEINSYFSYEMIELHDESARLMNRETITYKVPACFSRIIAQYRDLPDSQENVQRNQLIDENITRIGIEGDNFRKNIVCDLFNSAKNLDSSILMDDTKSFAEKLRFSNSNFRAIYTSSDLQRFRQEYSTQLNIKEKNNDPKSKKKAKDIEDRGQVLGGIGRAHVDFASSDAMFLIPFRHLTPEQIEKINDIKDLNESNNELWQSAKQAGAYYVGLKKDDAFYNEPEPGDYTAADFESVHIGPDEVQQELISIYDKITSLDDGSKTFWSDGYIRFVDSGARLINELANADGRTDVDDPQYKSRVSELMSDMSSLVVDRLIDNLKKTYPDQIKQSDVDAWKNLKEKMGYIRDTQGVGFDTHFAQWHDDIKNDPERLAKIQNIPDKIKKYAPLKSKAKVSGEERYRAKKTMEEYESAQQTNRAFGERLNEATKGRDDDNSAQIADRARLKTKKTFELLADEYLKNPNVDDRLKAVLNDISQYSKNQATSSSKNEYEAERKIYKKALKGLDEYMEYLDSESMNVHADEKDLAVLNDPNAKKADKDKALAAVNKAEANFSEKRIIAANIKLLINEMSQGGLVVPEKNAVKIDMSKTKIINDNASSLNYKDEPLFPHEPCPEDIRQGSIGDCYMLAGLSAIAANDPQKIKDCMVDNGDGTVTVRFFAKGPRKDYDTPAEVKPVYVTVDKMIPENGGSHASLWVQTLERAYTASGIHMGNPVAGGHVPSNIKQLYEDYKKMDPKDLPSHTECPWLIDAKGNLHEWQPNYNSISSGHSDEFVSELLGPEYEGGVLNLQTVQNNIDGHDDTALFRINSDMSCKIIFDFISENDPQTLEGLRELARAKGKTIENTFASSNDAMMAMRQYLKKNDLQKRFNKDGSDPQQMTEEMTAYDGMTMDFTLNLFAMENFNDNYLDDNGNPINGGNIVNAEMMEKKLKELDDFLKAGKNPVLMGETEAKAVRTIRSAQTTLERAEKNLKKEEEALNADKENAELKKKHEDNIKKYKDQIDNCTKTISEKQTALDNMKQDPRKDELLKNPAFDKFMKYYVQQGARLAAAEKAAQRSGVYSQGQDVIWDVLNENVKEGNIINCATGPEGSSKMPGVVNGHAHSVLGVYTQKIGDKDVRFVRVRNPHGVNGRMPQYVIKDDKISDVVEQQTDAGYADIELSDFISNYPKLYLNGNIHKENTFTAQLVENEKYADPKNADVMDIDAYKQYNDTLGKIKESLDKGSRDSSQFREFLSGLEDFKRYDNLYKKFSDVRIAMEDLEGSCVRYLSHCVEKPRWGSRRAGRIDAANACRDLYGMIKNGEKNPERRMKLDIAKKCINTFITSAKSKGAKGATVKNLEDNVDQLAERMISDEKFKKIVGNKDFLELSKLSHKKPSDFAKTFKGVAVTEKSMKELIKEPEVKKGVQPELKGEKKQDLVM